MFDGRFDKLSITTEFKPEEKVALEWLIDWSADFAPDIYCIHIDLKHTESFARHMEEFSKDFAGNPLLHFEVLDSTNMEAALVSFLEEKEIDILAMVIHQRNFFKELFNYSMTKKMAYHLDQPILAIQASCMLPQKKK
jgi:hypothetical protein